MEESEGGAETPHRDCPEVIIDELDGSSMSAGMRFGNTERNDKDSSGLLNSACTTPYDKH